MELRHFIHSSRPLITLCAVVLLTVLTTAHVASQSRNRRRAPTRSRLAIDYSRFSHSTEKHRKECKVCHNAPTSNWQKTSAFPDITDYPDHEDCVSCHRPQFFRGARPVICTVCHKQVAPRAADRLAFPPPSIPRQFVIEFPHDKHQDVIAKRLQTRRQPSFVAASFSPSVQGQKNYNNCTICHQPKIVTATSNEGWLDNYIPDSLTFKTVPVDHSSCFNCHWKEQKPVRDSCDGCHKLRADTATQPLSASRISIKFKHDGGGEKKNHLAECTTCHINITRAASLRGLKPDVPITSCTECHNKDGLRLDVSGELAKLDKNREFVCSYCHTSDVGRKDPPASHYVISGREPKTRKELER